MAKNSKLKKNTIKKITTFNSFINQLEFHKKKLEKLIAEKKQYLTNKTISNDNGSKNQINVDVSKKNDELVSTINEHDRLLTAINSNNMRIEINEWKNKELKLELKLFELITEMSNIILLNDTQLVSDLVHKRPKWYARFKITKWFNKNWSDQYEEWEKIKNKLKINLINQNKKNKDRKIQSIDPADFLSNKNQNKISNWNEEIKKIKTEMINLHARKLITTIYWEKKWKK